MKRSKVLMYFMIKIRSKVRKRKALKLLKYVRKYFTVFLKLQLVQDTTKALIIKINLYLNIPLEPESP